MTDYTHKRKHPKQQKKIMCEVKGRMRLFTPKELALARERYQRKYGRPYKKGLANKIIR